MSKKNTVDFDIQATRPGNGDHSDEKKARVDGDDKVFAHQLGKSASECQLFWEEFEKIFTNIRIYRSRADRYDRDYF